MKTKAFKTGKNHGGVQCHSVGSIYPARIYVKGAGPDSYIVRAVLNGRRDVISAVACGRDKLKEALRECEADAIEFMRGYNG